MNGDRIKLSGARWLYRWQMAVSIVGAAFSLMTFVGVFTILLSPWLGQFGLNQSSTLFLLLGTVLALVMGLGLFLDKIAKFWAAQAAVSTVRNPWLMDRLYEKEFLTMKTQHIPVVLALRTLLADGGKHPELVDALDSVLARLEETVTNKRWTIKPGEEVYEE